MRLSANATGDDAEAGIGDLLPGTTASVRRATKGIEILMVSQPPT